MEPSSALVDLVGFGAIAAGGVGCVWGGVAADKIGREKLVNFALAVSGTCCLVVGFLFGQSYWLLVPVVLAVEMNYAPPIWLSVTLWPALAFVMAMSLLQPVKGTVVALQWHAGLHGFEAARKARQRPASS